MRRRYRWAEIALMAREAGGAYRLHPDLATVTHHTLHHARRRVRALRPTDTHVYEFARGTEALNDLGEHVFDLYIRFTPKGTDP
jgi:hypothetical protein